MADSTEPALAGRKVVLAESRELDLLAQMLERLGATALRYPLVAILDSEDETGIKQWLDDAIAGRFDDVLLYTGEGLRRLLGFADRFECRDPFIESLSKVRKITRGPKPAKALREIGLSPDLRADPPTTQGIVQCLSSLDLQGRTLGIQLFAPGIPDDLATFLGKQMISYETVSPYRYAPASDSERVSELIEVLGRGEVDVIAFTSASQVDRLFEVADEKGLRGTLEQAMKEIKIAAVGPVVEETLQSKGYSATIAPKDSFFMKPLVNAIAEHFRDN